MTIKIIGKNIDVGDALREHLQSRIEESLNKYLGRSFPGHASIEKVNGNFATLIFITLWSGINLQAKAEAPDPYASADAAAERIDKRLRRYKRRLKDHHAKFSGNGRLPAEGAMNYVIQPYEGDENDEEKTHETNGAPVIIAETRTEIRQLQVSDAVMEMDLSEQSFLIFKNAKNGKINIIYRRDDGNIGWIDPELNKAS